MTLNESLEMRFNVLSKEYTRSKKELTEKDIKLKEQEEEIRLMKSQLLNYENKINTLTAENSEMRLKIFTKADNLETQKLTIEVLEQQIHAINEALNSNQTSIEQLLTQKSRLVSSKFQEFIQDDINFKEIKLPEYFNHSYNFNFQPFYNQMPQSVILNPDYNENKQNGGFSLKNLEDPNIYSSESYAGKMEEEKNDGEDESSVSNDQNKKSLMKESFIDNLDLQNAFANAADVIYLFQINRMTDIFNFH